MTKTRLENYVGQKRVIKMAAEGGRIVPVVYEAKHQTCLSDDVPNDPKDSIVTFVRDAGRINLPFPFIYPMPASLVEEWSDKIEFTGFQPEEE